ncbi:MAG: MarR family transcriptional regulator [Actinobacteria bacterium]|nr:MarR family transcriptional regulator [Actinomycetota bacterium]NDB42853.1 MarR family transcriptional regulator [Actinomycetota bacterium]NDC91310.1 MarR family transcriptional regulator [Acidimicrobiia bacterium]NDD72839.1 MarR family transcriptional regulator [Actinomycetota bacterium]
MAKAKWLTDAEMRAWRGFIERSADLINIITKDLEPFGLDGGDYQLLAMLSEAPGRKMKMCDLAETLGLSRSGLTRRMEGVLKAKYVSRVGDQNDRRAAFAQITEKGLSLIKKVAPHHVASVRRHMIDLLSPSEIAAFGSGFTKIGKKLSQKTKI